MANPVILYHASCNDGFCAAWAAWKKFGKDATYIPVNYGQPVPQEALAPVNPDEARDLYLLDFTYEHDILCELTSYHRQVMVLDHHPTRLQDLQDTVGEPQFAYIYDPNRSGARLAWEFFHDKPAPWIVYYCEDRDLWRHALPYTHEIRAFMESHPHDFNVWSVWALAVPEGETWYGYVGEGTAILRYQRSVVDAAVKHAVEIELEGYKVPSLNTTTLISEIGQQLAKDKPFSATWFQRSDGKRIWSLRSDPNGLNVGEIAKRRGGGGHKHAAGFQE